MKTRFKKLRELGLHRHDKRDRNESLPQSDELSQASQDMQDMKDCYDGLLVAAAATANNAYEFSESLREMGDCLLEKTSLNDDEDSGRVLLMLGKAQLEIQKLLDNYRSHISRTITVPSESLLNELRIVEDMKKQCDEKRMSYEEMRTKQKEKGRLRNSKGECFSSHQLQAARDEFDEDATLFVFRMKSLKRGQSRSLLTQAARHHAAQMCFFRKALKSLEAIEPNVRLVTEQQHIDYQFSGLEDDDRDSVFLTEDENDEEDDSDDENIDMSADGELSFDCQRNDQKNKVSSSGNSMELDSADLTFPQVASVSSIKPNMHRRPLWNSIDVNAGSKSAPLSDAARNLDRQLRQSPSPKLNTYVLPTPLEKKPENVSRNEKLQSVLNGNSSSKPTPLPIPLTEGAKKVKIYAFSEPLNGNPQRFSGSLSRPVSSPKISELHELPRPPDADAAKKASKVGFSAPLAMSSPLPVPSPGSQREIGVEMASARNSRNG